MISLSRLRRCVGGIDELTRRPGPTIPNISHVAAFHRRQRSLQHRFEFVGRAKCPLFGAKKLSLSVPYFRFAENVQPLKLVTVPEMVPESDWKEPFNPTIALASNALLPILTGLRTGFGVSHFTGCS